VQKPPAEAELSVRNPSFGARGIF